MIRKPPILEGWSESDLVAIYNAAPVRHLQKGDPLFRDREYTDSFFVLLDGSIQVVLKWDGHIGRPGIVHRGDCMPPLSKSPGLLYCSEAVEPCTFLELTPTLLGHLPERTQLCLYKLAIKAGSRFNTYTRAIDGEITSKIAKLAAYISANKAQRRVQCQSQAMDTFLGTVPRLPTYGIDLMLKLLDDKTLVQDVVDAIKQDSAIAALVLRVVNSAHYGLPKKIETFYHACMILGFNNLSSLIMREAVQAAFPKNDETQTLQAHSCLISVLCYEVCSCAQDVPTQAIMTLGLLHDVGKSVQVVMKRARWAGEEYIDTFDAAKLGGNLLRKWELPERICQMVEMQEDPEYTPPDLVPAEFRRELGVLHIAHVLESLIVGQPPASTIYTKDYMKAIGITVTPEELLKQRITPVLSRSARRLPQGVQLLLQSFLKRPEQPS